MNKINVAGVADSDLKQLGLSRTTIWRARKRGWAALRYHKRVVPPPNKEAFDPAIAYDRANKVYASTAWKDAGRALWREDLIQEAVLRLWDYSGRSIDPGYQWVVARDAMNSFMRSTCRPGFSMPAAFADMHGESLEFEDEALVLDQLRVLAGDELYRAALAGNPEAVEEIRRMAWN